MAKTFYYDSIGLIDSTLDDGTFSSTSFSSGSNNITGENNIVDHSISNAVTGFGRDESIKISTSLGSCDFIALYFTSAETSNLSFNHGVASNIFTQIIELSTDFTAGWNVFTFSDTGNKTDWYLNSTSGTIDGLTEIIFGTTLAFEINPDLGISESEKFGTDVNTSIGGVQYGVKRHEPIKTTTLTFSSISSTFKSSLQAMQDEIQDYKKFIYSEDGTTGPFHYVRLGKPIDFKEVSVNRFSCTINLVEQLS